MASKTGKTILVLLALLVVGGGAAYVAVSMRAPAEDSSKAQTPVSPPAGVSSLGRIRPEDAPVVVGARSLSGQPSVIRELRVKEGDTVKAGQVIAVLDSQAQLEAAVKLAEERVKVAEVRLKQVKTGAKPADLAAIQAQIARLEAELANAQTTFTRTQNLFRQDLVSQAVLDRDRFPLNTIPPQIAELKERMKSIAEVRPVDVEVAEAEIRQAEADVQRARTEVTAAVIHAPYSGMVLKVHAWQGSEVGSQGILEIARVEKMYVVAEVAESDVVRVKVGERAKITGYSLPQPLEGAVERLGYKVSRNSIAIENPVNITDARVMEVWILVDEPAKVRNLIDAQVTVVLTP